NKTFASAAGTMRHRGMAEDEILAALLVMNANRCDPQLDEDEIRKIAKSVCRYEPESEAGAALEREVSAKDKDRRIVTKPASAIRSERVRWLSQRRIPLRGVTVVAGE